MPTPDHSIKNQRFYPTHPAGPPLKTKLIQLINFSMLKLKSDCSSPNGFIRFSPWFPIIPWIHPSAAWWVCRLAVLPRYVASSCTHRRPGSCGHAPRCTACLHASKAVMLRPSISIGTSPLAKTMVCNCLQLENLKLIQKPNQSIMAATPNQTNPLNFPTYFHTNHVGLNKKPN